MDMEGGPLTFRSPSAAGRPSARWRSCARKATPSRRSGSRGAPSPRTFWGKAWCDNLESYRDYENRLPRGRTYVRNGSVVDLQIAPLAGEGDGQRVVDLHGHGQHRGGAEGAVAVPVPGLRGRDRLPGRASAGAVFRRVSWSGSAVRTTACFPSRRKSGSRAVARTRRRCASTSRRCFTASARGWTRSRSFCSGCARGREGAGGRSGHGRALVEDGTGRREGSRSR